MQIPALTTKVKAADLPLEMVAKNTSLSEADKVKEVSRQFESVLLKQILTESRKKTDLSGGEESSGISDIYNDMVTNQIADSISRSGSFGLASSLQSQLVRQTLSPKPPADAAAESTKK